MIGEYHLTEAKLSDLKAGRLSKEEMLELLKHIGACESCADFLAGSYHEMELLGLPPDFKEMVFAAIQRVKSEPVSNNASVEKRESLKKNPGAWRNELCLYSFKVSLAACIALLLLFSGTLEYGISIEKTMNPDLSGVNMITEKLRVFSDKLVDFEIIKE